MVAPLAGSVDRNWLPITLLAEMLDVAPLAGSVDRNAELDPPCGMSGVAPLAGSVDRNIRALDAMRAEKKVAPLAGSVDRNMVLSSCALFGVRRSPRGERG